MMNLLTKKRLFVGGFFKVKHLKTVGSTNDFCKSFAKGKAREGFVVVADEQTGGKGRFDRKFFSPKGGLYFSVLFKPKNNDVFDMLTVLAAVAVCDAIREVCNEEAGIKWVNDLLIDGKKCCGILSETTENLEGFAIVGIGVNIGNEMIDESLKDIACGVKCGGKNTRFELLESILSHLKKLYQEFDKAAVVEAYKKRCVILGRRVRVAKNSGEEFDAFVQEVDADCHLIVKDDAGKPYVLDSGEVKILL